MYAKSIKPSAKREVRKERSAKRDDQIALPIHAQICERSELRAMIFFITAITSRLRLILGKKLF